MPTIKTECRACGGTGIYHGFAEPEGVGVLCVDCEGTGCHQIQYTPFVERKRRRGIERVRRSRGSFLATGVGPTGGEITYQEFLQGKMP